MAISDLSELKTDVEIIKKLLFGNGVKGVITKVDDLEDKLDDLEIYMEKTFNEKIQILLDKIEEKRKFNWGQAIIVITVLADVTINLLS